MGDIFTSTSEGIENIVADEEKSTVGIIFGILGGFILNVVSSLAIGTACGIFDSI